MRYLWIYMIAIIGVNFGFKFIPLIETPIGSLSPMAVIVGAIFVLRDYAQREVGDWVLAAMVFGAIATYIMVDPFIALASVTAFSASEIIDYAAYTYTKKPFHQRVLLSSAVAVPVDSFVFLYLIDFMTAGTFILMILSKMIAAMIIYVRYQSMEPKD